MQNPIPADTSVRRDFFVNWDGVGEKRCTTKKFFKKSGHKLCLRV